MAPRWFVLPINPEPWAVGPVGVARRGGALKPYVGRNQQLDAFKEAVKEEIGQQEFVAPPIELKLFFWRNRAEYRTPKEATHRKHEADLTNMQKAVEDALQGVLFENDRDVSHIDSYLVQQGPDVTPRIVVCADSSNLLDPDLIPPHVWEEIDMQDLATAMNSSVRFEGEVPF